MTFQHGNQQNQLKNRKKLQKATNLLQKMCKKMVT